MDSQSNPHSSQRDTGQSSPKAGSSAQSRRLVVILGVGAWFLLSVIVASQNYAEALLAGSHVSFWLQGAWTLALLSYWVVAAPVILWLHRRFSFERGRLIARILLHIGVVIGRFLAGFLSFVAEPLRGKVQRPVDHFLRGTLAGLFSNVFGADVECIETHCTALGGGDCRLIVKPHEEMDFSKQRVRDQLRP